jgi:D-tyrosyl-tRNA(Tyr) deacylase
MRVVIQRVVESSVTVDGQCIGAIGPGMMVLCGFEPADTEEDLVWTARKIAGLRIFDDAEGVMNLPITEVPDAGILVVSQFTLMASTRKGNRPSYVHASRPDFAIPMYERFIARLSALFGKSVQTGTFGADMQVALVNDGPVTILLDSHLRDRF